MDRVVRDRLPTAEDVLWDCGGRNFLVGVVNLIDVPHVDDVYDVGDVAHVRHVDQPKIITAVVIPGEKGVSWTERKPAHEVDSNAD